MLEALFKTPSRNDVALAERHLFTSSTLFTFQLDSHPLSLYSSDGIVFFFVKGMVEQSPIKSLTNLLLPHHTSDPSFQVYILCFLLPFETSSPTKSLYLFLSSILKICVPFSSNFSVSLFYELGFAQNSVSSRFSIWVFGVFEVFVCLLLVNVRKDLFGCIFVKYDFCKKIGFCFLHTK